MKTFLSWLIANLGGAVYTVLIIGFEAMLFCGRIPVPEEAGTAGMALNT